MGIEQKEDVYYRLWIEFVREAFSCLDRKNKCWISLPGAGGYYDQDLFFLKIWETVKFYYYQAIEDKDFMQQVENYKKR